MVAATTRALHDARITLGISQAALASELGWSQSFVSRLDRNKVPQVSLLTVSMAASVLGLEPALTLHRIGPAIRDKGHEALIARLLRLLSPAWHVAREVPFPNPGDPRFWDLMLRLTDFRLGVEAETRIRDLQALVRRMRERATDGGADALLLILSDSGHNRGLVADLRTALGDDFRTPPNALLQALRSGGRLTSSGVVLL